MRQCYRPIQFQSKSRETLDRITEIVENYEKMGLRLSLRQLYYALVTKNLIKNDKQAYKRLGSLVSDARIAGVLDWELIEDRGRVPKKPPEFESLQSLVDAALWSYRLPRLKGQSTYVELWVEKDALAGVLAPVASRHHVTLCVNKGYSSSSAIYDAATRICQGCYDPQNHNLVTDQALILYLGDFDPSGEDMVRDIRERLNVFLDGTDESWANEDGMELTENPMGVDVSAEDRPELEVRKIALTMEQIKQYKPPPNPAKQSDSRSRAFIAKHGASSWEVDALPPEVLQGIIEGELENALDQDLIEEIKEQERSDKEELKKAVAEIMSRRK